MTLEGGHRLPPSKLLTFFVTFITSLARIELIAPCPGQDPHRDRFFLNHPQLCADFASDLRLPLSFGPLLFRQPPVLELRRCDPCPALLGPRSGTPPSMTRAAPRPLHSRTLARRPSLGSCATAMARPIWSEASCSADFVAFFKPHNDPRHDCYSITLLR